VVAIADQNPAAAKAASQKYSVDKTFGDTKDLYSTIEDLDAVSIITPNVFHHPLVMEALAAGKHVFCEKPLGRTAAEARELRDAAVAAGVVHMVGFNYRFLPAIQLARRLIAEGRLGRLHHFRGRFADGSLLDPEAPFTWHQDAAQAGANAVLDLGSHLIDMARYLLGEPLAVTGAVATFTGSRPDPGRGGARRPVETEDAFEAILELEGEALGSVGATTVAAGRRASMTFEVNGSRGTLAFDLERLNSLQVHLVDEAPEGGGLREVHVTEPGHLDGGDWWPPGHGVGWEASLTHELHHRLAAVAGAAPVAPRGATFEDGYRCAVVCDAILTSARTGRRVGIRY
jgi:predicted dehydrogenase